MSTTATTTFADHRILLVDDDVDGRDAIARFLEREGADVAVAGDGAEALKALQADPRRCLILLDLEMPGMDGREFRRRQRLSSTMAFIPVVVVSGLPNLAAATRDIAPRAELRKPVGLALLLQAVGAHCGGH
jgi:CheY-like chemotaxis protein